MKAHKIFLFITFAFSTYAVFAQTDSTLTKQVEVIKAYQPSINAAYKIGSSPRINDTINYSPTFDYSIYSRDIPVEKTINHLPVVQLGRAPRVKTNTGWAKLGFGNAWSSNAELYVNTSPSKKTDFGLELKHFQTRPTILLDNGLKIKPVPNSNNLARIFVKNYFRKSVLDWDLQYQRDGFRYYGFPGIDSLNYRNAENYSTDLNTRQAFNSASTNVRLKNMNTRSKLDYTLNFGYDYFWNATGQSAHTAKYNGLFTKDNRKYQLLLGTQFVFYYDKGIESYIDTSSTRISYLAEITPQIAIDKGNYQLKAGFNLATMIGADSTLLWNISPNIYFIYHPIEGMLSLFAGANGGFTPNNYKAVAYKNQYINYTTSVHPTEEVVSIYGGFKGKISKNLSYLFDVNYSINKNNPFHYLTRNINGSADTVCYNTFNVEYDNVNVLKFGGKLRYSSNNVLVDLSGNYYIYDAKKLTTLSYMPDFDITLNTKIDITSQISAKVDASLIGPRDAVSKTYNTSTYTLPVEGTSSSEKLDMIIDLNAGVNYTFTKKLNLYIEAKNILNSNYQVWQGYNHQRLLVMAGATYTF